MNSAPDEFLKSINQMIAERIREQVAKEQPTPKEPHNEKQP